MVDILDRDGSNRRGCSARSFDESGPLEMKDGQRPSDMQSYIEENELSRTHSKTDTFSKRPSLKPNAMQMQAILEA